MSIFLSLQKSRYFLLVIAFFLYSNSTSQDQALNNNINSVLDGLEQLASADISTTVNDLRSLFDLLNVQSTQEAITYIQNMHQDLESIIKELGAIDFEQALNNAKQYKSVFDQVLQLKDAIRSTPM